MARYTKELLTRGHPAPRQFVKRYGFAPSVLLHVAEVTARSLVALEQLPAALRAHFSDPMVMTSYYTRTRSIAVAHPLVQVDKAGRLAMEPQPFLDEGTETVVLGGRLAIHAGEMRRSAAWVENSFDRGSAPFGRLPIERGP